MDFRKLLPALFLLFSSTNALAIPLSPGDSVKIDFDLTSSSTSGPFNQIGFSFIYGSGASSTSQPLTDIWDPTDQVKISLYDSTDTLLNSHTWGTNLFSSPTWGWSSGITTGTGTIADGMGYIVYELLQGSLDLYSAKFYGYNSSTGASTGWIDAASYEPLSAQVPSPAPLALIALGFALLAMRKQKLPGLITDDKTAAQFT